LLFFIAITEIRALDPQKNVSQYSLNIWRSDRGLPLNTILDILQDHSKYIWLGTNNGLVRFDGVNFVLFDSKNTEALGDSFINTLYEDRQGILWCGTYRGDLIKVDRGKFTRQQLALSGSSRNIHAITEDAQGNLWIAVANGLICKPAGFAGRYIEDAAFVGEKIVDFLKDSNGHLWLSTNKNGLFKREREQWRHFALPGANSNILTKVIYQTRDGRLWIGTDNGVYVFNGNKMDRITLGSGMNESIICFLEDRDFNLWVGTENGLYRIASGQIQKLIGTQGLGNNLIYSLCEDNEGSIWVGTIDGGLWQLRDEKITTFTSLEGLGGDLVRSLHGTSNGKLWIGGQGDYLSCLYNGHFEKNRLPTQLLGGSICSIETDNTPSVWLGTNRGLFHFQQGRFLEISMPISAKTEGVETRCVLKDRASRLWVGTWGKGLGLFEKGKWIWYTTEQGLAGSHISCMYEDLKGTLWVGSEMGLDFLPAHGSGAFSAEPNFNGCQVVSLFQDRGRALWVGTYSQGLKVLQNGRIGSVTIDQGLFDNRVYAILEDNNANLWLSSERGIFYAAKSDLEAVAWGRSPKVAGHFFTEENGLKSRICNRGQPAGWKSADGRLWFATLKGVAVVDPSRLRPSDQVPPVLLEETVVDRSSLPLSGTSMKMPLKLAAGSKRFEFKYTALSFIRSDKIEFKYKLEGYDRDWTNAGSRRVAFYNDLRPGRYCFRVIAANADGVWNLAGASFFFYLRPFIYQIWWFRVLAALAFGVSSVLSWQLLKRYLHAVSFWKKKTHIGHFKILETIGSGGMATIYKAQDTLGKKRIVALKVLKEENFHDELQKKRFKHESLITEQLDHPHIVHIIERGEIDDCWYIAMELLRGESLAMLIRRDGRLPVGAALDIMLQIVDALQAIHVQNIVHRDLKPENIMVSERHGQRHFVKLLDFGLAITPAQSRLTMSGVVMGTIRYLPPERISDGISSPAGDIYSAGIILYEMVTGSKPFWSEATGEVIHRIMKTYPLPPREISSEIPLELNALIMAMIDKDPAQRPVLAAIRGELQRLAEKFPAQSRSIEKQKR
jgi:ligand-binding sensor domain-containing protein/tRNA A-37 threonylcarbamoyl transferase component Bud32